MKRNFPGRRRRFLGQIECLEPRLALAALLDDFSSARLNGDGTALWSPYLGEDPNQTGSVVTGQYQLNVGSGSGAYMQFFPRSGGYSYPAGYAENYIESGAWDKNFNRLSFWVKPNISTSRDSGGGDTLQIGTYVRDKSTSDTAMQGAHYYHLLDPNFYANQWVYVELNRTPQHQVGGSGGTNWGENPTAPQVNYYEGLTRFYFDTQVGVANSSWIFDDFTFDTVANEPDDLVSSVAAVYTGSRYEVTWAGPKNVSQQFEIAYSTSSMKVSGFASGTAAGTVSNPGNDYTGTIWQSPAMAKAQNFYVAIRPVGRTQFTEIYVPDYGGSAPDIAAPIISSVATSNLTASAATVAWTTNEAADTQVDYGTSTSYGSSSTLNTSQVTSHSVGLTALAASTTYHYRVRSRDAAGNLALSGDFTFTTAAADTTAPTISGVATSNLTASAITIAWTTNEAADTQVDYGTSTIYGSSSTLNTSQVTSHSVNLSSLAASTTYHYRVRSRDAAGNLALSGDFTFTTSAADTTAPTISGVATSNLTASGVTIAWATNEAADTQVEYGTSTTYGSSSALNTSQVTDHSVNLSSLAASTTYHYRVRSRDAAGNLALSGDFSFTTSADTVAPTISGVASSNLTASGGTVAWTTNEAADTQVDYGTSTSYGSSSTLNASLVTSHSVNLSGLTASTAYHYRVRSRDAAGNLALSGDFTFTTTPVGTAGLVASYNFNAGAGSTVIDASGKNNTGTIRGATWTTVGKYGSALSFNGTTSRVDIPDSSALRLTSGMTLEAWVKPSSTSSSWRDVIYKGNDNYYLSSTSTNASHPVGGGIVGASNLEAIGTASLAMNTWTHLAATYDGAAMRIFVNGIQASSVARTGAIVTSTNQLQIGGDSIFGQYFSGLIDEVRVYNRALTQAEIQSDMASADTTAPTISGITTSNLTASGVTIAWTTNEAADTQVDYGTSTSYGSSSSLNTAMITSHSVNLTGLAASTTYHYRVRSRDAAGNLALSGDFTFTTSNDITAPTISGVASSNLSESGVTIAWSTNEAADTQVDYGTSTTYGSSSSLNTAMITSHSVNLTGLAASTTYHYRVRSRDAAGNLALSGDFTFTTSNDITAPTISGVASSNLSESGVAIAWSTNEAADTQVDYGTSTSYGSSSALDTALVTSHSVGLTGLAASTTYHYRVRSRDAAGNLALSADFTFTTSADITAPTISGVATSNRSESGVTIAWSTNEAADTQVDYGTSTNYGSTSTLNTALATSHSVGLTGLAANTTYHYRVRSRDAASNLALSGDFSVTTSPNLLVTNQSIAENSPTNTLIGTLTANDGNSAPHTFTLVDSAEGRFKIIGNQLQVANGTFLDYEATTSHGIVVEVSSSGGATYQSALTINVTNVNEITSFDVQKGLSERSYVRYVDLIFESSSALDSLLSGNRLKLTRYGLDGVSNPVQVNLAGVVSRVGNSLAFNFGTQGIGGNRSSSIGDGYYRLSVDQDGDGAYEAVRSFYRMFGDVNGDQKVDDLDITLIRNAYGQSGSSLNADVNGDGFVNTTDRNYARNMKGHKLAAGLIVDD